MGITSYNRRRREKERLELETKTKKIIEEKEETEKISKKAKVINNAS